MFAEMRTGSNFLEANLNAMEGVTCHGEVFNPHFIGKKDQTEFMGLTLQDRANDPFSLLKVMQEQTKGLSGFRYFHDHDPRILQSLIDDVGCAKIILTRNPVESYVSWKIAQETGQWKLTNAKNLKSAQVKFDGREFEAHVAALQEFQVLLLNALQRSGQTAFYVDYEDINDLDVINGLAAFLGVKGLDALDGSLKKQNPDEIAHKVLNPEELDHAIARLDRFNLTRTPNFEPRRAPMVPHFMASSSVPLLYMPVRSGPVTQVASWLAGFGKIESEFNQKALRQWKRGRPLQRSFTVIRHPVARAHHAFTTQILSGALREIRGQLARVYKLTLPEIGRDYASAKEHREGFLAFLRWLKINVAGQTATRVDAHWASQSAILQGFSQFQSPDLIIREDRLQRGLEFLAEEVGAECPSLPVGDSFSKLAEIYDAEIEAAARDAYSRDYLAFGFSDWAAK